MAWVVTPFAGISAQALVINEVLGSTAGTDVEYIEAVRRSGQRPLDGLSIIVVEGMTDRRLALRCPSGPGC